MRKLGRKKTHREMMLKNLATAVILYESVSTTVAKAKEARTLVEKIINCGKKNTLASHRKLLVLLNDKKACKKVLEQLSPRYAKRVGGYMNIYKLAPRPGDASPMAMIKLIPDIEKKENLLEDKKAEPVTKIKGKKE